MAISVNGNNFFIWGRVKGVFMVKNISKRSHSALFGLMHDEQSRLMPELFLIATTKIVKCF